MIEAGKEDGSGSLTFEEMVADCFVVMLAGYDTSSNSLAFTTYLLAVHQDVQERLADAINDYFEENPVSYTSYQFPLSCDRYQFFFELW